MTCMVVYMIFFVPCAVRLLRHRQGRTGDEGSGGRGGPLSRRSPLPRVPRKVREELHCPRLVNAFAFVL